MIYSMRGIATVHLEKFIISLSAMAITSNVEGGGIVDPQDLYGHFFPFR